MPQKEINRKVVILGSGPAGLTAAIYASRAQLAPVVIDGPQPGGQLTITTDVENYPGFSNGIMGPEMMNEFRAQAERFGTEIINVWIDKIDLSERPFTLFGKDSQDSEEISTLIKAETLIISTGASAKWLGVPGEEPVPEGLGGNGVFGVCNVRRLLFSRQTRRHRRRRRYGDGRSDVFDALRLESYADAPPRFVSRFKNYAGARFRQ